MRRARWGILLGSVAFHALLALLIVLDLDPGPPPVEPPPMTVWLERPDHDAPRSKSEPFPPRAIAKPSSAAPAEPTATPPVAPAPAASAPNPSPAATAAAPAPSLRGLGGCRLTDLDRLSPDERARCQERLAQGIAGGGAAGPNLDPTGRYVRDARPYLTRPPKDGCKPVGSVTKLPMGQTSVTLAGGCGRSF